MYINNLFVCCLVNYLFFVIHKQHTELHQSLYPIGQVSYNWTMLFSIFLSKVCLDVSEFVSVRGLFLHQFE